MTTNDPIADAFAAIERLEDTLADARRERDTCRGDLIEARFALADAEWERDEWKASYARVVAECAGLLGLDQNGYRVGG